MNEGDSYDARYQGDLLLYLDSMTALYQNLGYKNIKFYQITTEEPNA